MGHIEPDYDKLWNRVENLELALASERKITNEAVADIARLRGLIADYLNARSTFDLSSGNERHDAADLLMAAERALRDA